MKNQIVMIAYGVIFFISIIQIAGTTSLTQLEGTPSLSGSNSVIPDRVSIKLSSLTKEGITLLLELCPWSSALF